MFKHYLIYTFKSLWRRKVHSLISILSLTIGLTVFAFSLLYVKKELTYDLGWPDAGRIHRLLIEQDGMPGMADGFFNTVIARGFPNIQNYFENDYEVLTRVFNTGGKPISIQGNSVDVESNYYKLDFVDPEFADIFQLEMVEGNLDQVLSGPGFIALEENFAARLSDESMFGKVLTIESFSGGQVTYEVGAIFSLPSNISNSVNFQQLTLIDEYSMPLFGGETQRYASWENSVQVWLKLKPEVTTDSFNSKQADFIDDVVTIYDEALGPDRKISDHLIYHWQPVTEMHLNPPDIEASYAGDSTRVLTFAVVGVLVLLVGCSNSVSLSLSSALERRREIGIRKAAGALKKDILIQYFGESILLALFALIPSVIFLKILQPVFFTLLQMYQPVVAGLGDYILLGLITILVGIASGTYPALLLSSVRPEAVLKVSSGLGIKKGQNLRQFLVGIQFCFASMLLFGTVALYTQLTITKSQPKGFSVDNVIFVNLNTPQERDNSEVFQQTLTNRSGIKFTSTAFNFPNLNQPLSFNSSSLVRKSEDVREIKAQMMPVSQDFLSKMEIPLIAGRYFDALLDSGIQSSEEQSEAPQEQRVILNRRASNALGFDSPEQSLNQLFYRRYTNIDGTVLELPHVVVGVVEDNMYSSIHRRPGPEIYYIVESYISGIIMLKYEEEVEDNIRQIINDVSLEINGLPVQNIIFMEQRLESAFTQEQNESRLLLYCAILTLLLACIGLYGLVSFSMGRNVKEVGVRKVLGASVGSITMLFLWRFSKPILLANVIAWPVAVYFILQWIQRFPYQLEKIWLLPLCLLTSLLVLLIAWITVGGLTAKAASIKPIESLRYE